MFLKLELEQGEYITAEGQVVNLISGNDIYTNKGKITSENLQGYLEFETIEKAMEYFGISKNIIKEAL